MIAILDTENEATLLAADIHIYLTENRDGYNAEKWQDLDKSDSAELWAVAIPPDYPYHKTTYVDYLQDWNIEAE